VDPYDCLYYIVYIIIIYTRQDVWLSFLPKARPVCSTYG